MGFKSECLDQKRGLDPKRMSIYSIYCQNYMIKSLLSSPLPHDITTIKRIVFSLCTDDGVVGKELMAMNKRIQLRESCHNKPLSLTNSPPPLYFYF